MSDGWHELGQRTRPRWIVRNGIWLMMVWTALLFAVAAWLPFGNIVTAPVHFGASTTAVITVPRTAASGIHPPQSASVTTAGREVPATITAVLPSEGDRVPLRVRVSKPLPASAGGTVSIRLAHSSLLSQLFSSARSQ